VSLDRIIYQDEVARSDHLPGRRIRPKVAVWAVRTVTGLRTHHSLRPSRARRW